MVFKSGILLTQLCKSPPENCVIDFKLLNNNSKQKDFVLCLVKEF